MLSDTMAYVTVIMVTVIFTVFALTIQDAFWKISLKMLSMICWFIMGLTMFYFFGFTFLTDIFALLFVIVGFFFPVSVIKDMLDVKKERAWSFKD